MSSNKYDAILIGERQVLMKGNIKASSFVQALIAAERHFKRKAKMQKLLYIQLTKHNNNNKIRKQIRR